MVTGARQVGKTFSIRKVGKEYFDNVVEINFVEQPDAIELFSEQKGAKDLLLRLSAFTKKPLVPSDTVWETGATENRQNTESGAESPPY